MVGVCRVKLRLPWSHSLKDKRRLIHKIIDRVRHRFNASIAEIADQDEWQIATLAIALVNTDSSRIEQNYNIIIDFLAEESEILEIEININKC